jgi:hypothetical protein
LHGRKLWSIINERKGSLRGFSEGAGIFVSAPVLYFGYALATVFREKYTIKKPSFSLKEKTATSDA